MKIWADEYFLFPRAGLYLQAGITFLNAWVFAATQAPRAPTDRSAVNQTKLITVLESCLRPSRARGSAAAGTQTVLDG